MQLLLARFIMMLLLCGPACTIALASDLPTQEQLRHTLEQAQQGKMPGLRAAIRDRDGVIVRAAVGQANKKTGQLLDNEIGMPGGSTGKTFAAALTMLLIEDGVLSLDDRASQWLGETDWYADVPNADTIRVRHLLSHSAGLGDYPSTWRFNMGMLSRVLRHGSAYFEPEELIGMVSNRKPLFAAGKGYSYSDAGYLILGRVIEAATGRSYYELLEERILEPQQLHQVRVADQAVLTGITPGYMGGSTNLKKDGRMKFDPRSEWTGGGLITNPTMLVKFIAALAEGKVVSPDSFEQMLAGGWYNPETRWHYGYGLFVDNRRRGFSHAGLWPGYRTYVRHCLLNGTTVSVQTNRDGKVDLRGIADRINPCLP